MNNVFFLIMRRMRQPLLVLVTVYAIAILGMTLVPGQTDDGAVHYIDFFHAFYFVAFMGTTIGFGEIPYPFTGAQRLWVMLALHMTVVAWIYAIGTLLALLKDSALQGAMVEQRFAKHVQQLREDFYLVCGYGDTGRALVGALEENLMRTVVIESDAERINRLTLEDYPVYVPALCADASKPRFLRKGGLKNPCCQAVVAVTNNNFVNLHVAITSKLLNPSLPVLCRVDSSDVEANMLSFGTDYVINPFHVFAAQLSTALHSPYLYMLRECLVSGKPLGQCKLLHPPKQGLWILCGYGRFGQAIYQEFLEQPGIELVIIEVAARGLQFPQEANVQCVVGRGTEAHTLLEGRVHEAVGIVAGTNDDVDNLSIIMTARELNPELFVVIRQNLASNQIIFDAARANVVMQASQITADYIHVLLTVPLLRDFIEQAKFKGEAWTQYLLRSIREKVTRQPLLWETVLSPTTAPALWDCLTTGHTLSLECLLRSPADRNQDLPCLPLMLVREDTYILLPDATELLQVNDHILWCGQGYSQTWMSWTLQDPFVLAYMVTGEIMPRSWLWRWLQKRWQRRNISVSTT